MVDPFALSICAEQTDANSEISSKRNAWSEVRSTTVDCLSIVSVLFHSVLKLPKLTLFYSEEDRLERLIEGTPEPFGCP